MQIIVQAQITLLLLITFVCVYFQVVWLGEPLSKTTWETATDLPIEMVKEYEQGLKRDIQEDMHISGGQTVCTLSTALKPLQPEAKKTRLQQASLTDSSNSGYVTLFSKHLLKSI